MSHSTTIIGEVTARAILKHGKQDDYETSKRLWLEEAEAWRKELETEGLIKTIEQLDRAIAFVRK